jgi:hypothetical protein
MLKSVPIHNGAHQQRAQDAELLKESGAHKLVITDRDGNCLAFVLAWDSFDYDPESYTAGEIKSVPGANMYVLTAPDGFSGRRAL